MPPRCGLSRRESSLSIAAGQKSPPSPGRQCRPARQQEHQPSKRGEKTMPSAAYVNTLLFGVYPYVCLSVLLIGSLIRFDREPYTWKSDSSQMLRAGQLRLGSNLFHYGVIVVILGHFA